MFWRQFSRRLSSVAGGYRVQKVNPFASIKIVGNLNYRIQPFDLFECQDSNLLRASIIDPSKGALLDHVRINVTADTIEISDSVSDEGAWCLLEVPIKADLSIVNGGDSEISDMHSDLLEVTSRFVRTKNINSREVRVESEGAECLGILLGQEVFFNVKNGDLNLHKVQGEKLFVTHEGGRVVTNSCYANFSSFECKNSILRLKNVHKVCQISGQGSGEVHMSGFYGTLLLDVADYKLNLQLSELVDVNRIRSANKDQAFINMAEKVFEECRLSIHGNYIGVDKKIVEMDSSKMGDKDTIVFNKEDLKHQLSIDHAGQTVLGKLDWADTFDFKEKIKSAPT